MGNNRDATKADFSNLLMDYFLQQQLKVPATEINTIDLVMVWYIDDTEHLGKSEHNIVNWKLIRNEGVGNSKQQIRQSHKVH